jgi:co-chaperonin GroES (HSP10)
MSKVSKSFKAIGSFVVLEKEKEEVKNSMGLIMTEANEKDIRYKLAKVKSVGDDVLGICNGDSVYFDSAAGSDIRINGDKLTIVHDRNIVVVL